MGDRSLGALIKLFFLFAGFSQITYQGIKPIDLLIGVILVVLLLNGYLKMKKMFFFLIASTLYAFLIGKMEGLAVFFTDVSVIILTVSLYVYFLKINQTQLQKNLNLFNISMFLSNLMALSTFLWIPAMRVYVIDMSSYGYRLKGLFNQPNGYAFVLLISIPISIYLFTIGKNKVFNLLTLLIGVFALILTQSRGAIFSLFVGVAFLYVFYGMYSSNKLIVKRFIIVCICSIVSLYTMYAVAPHFLKKNLGISLSRISPLKVGFSERKIVNIGYEDIERDRLYLVFSALETLAVYPFGLGYQDKHEFIGKTTGIYLIPHNYFLHIFLTFGVFFGIIWNCIIARAMFKGFCCLKNYKIQHNELFFYLQMIIIIVSLFYLTHSPEWIYFYVILSMYFSILYKSKLPALKKRAAI